MGRPPCCDEKGGVKKGPWTAEEDKKLVDYITTNGHGSWRALPKLAGLNRCGKSCRLRWTNYLRPDIKRGRFSDEEEKQIIELHSLLGNKWSAIATRLPGRTDNEIKNYWNTHIRKKLTQMGIDPVTHRPRADLTFLANLPNLLASTTKYSPANLPMDGALLLQAEAAQLARTQLLQTLVQVLAGAAPLSMADFSTNQLMEPGFLQNHPLPDLHGQTTLQSTYLHNSGPSLTGGEELASLAMNNGSSYSNMFPDHVDNTSQVSNSMPSLVSSSSPENIFVDVDQTKGNNSYLYHNNASASTIPTTTTVCESLCIDDPSEELNWKEVFNTAESPTWSFQL